MTPSRKDTMSEIWIPGACPVCKDPMERAVGMIDLVDGKDVIGEGARHIFKYSEDCILFKRTLGGEGGNHYRAGIHTRYEWMVRTKENP